MSSKNDITLRTVVIAVAAIFALLIICLGILITIVLFVAINSNKAVLPTRQENQASLPEIKLGGLWQQNRSMAAGWADRYHFYPSGTYRFYPNEMTCMEEKIAKMGTWKVEDAVLTLTTIRQIVKTYEISPGGKCRVIETKEVQLADPHIEQFTIVDHGLQEGDIYPSISIDDQQFWKFSDDASSYGDEEFPE